MPQLQAVKERIRTISNLRKVTTAMELVTRTKIGRVRRNAENARRFEEMFRELYASVMGATGHEPRRGGGEAPTRIVIGFFSQKGFCGDFNTKLLRTLHGVLGRDEAPSRIILVGRRSGKWAHGVGAEFQSLTGLEASYRGEAAPILAEIEQAILSGESTELHFVYNRFVSVLEQTPTALRVYPAEVASEEAPGESLFEPDLESLSRALVLGYLEACFERAYWESLAGENAARLLAMKNANDNASMILDDQRVLYNKMRQAAITQELAEIVSAFDVLKAVQGRERE